MYNYILNNKIRQNILDLFKQTLDFNKFEKEINLVDDILLDNIYETINNLNKKHVSILRERLGINSEQLPNLCDHLLICIILVLKVLESCKIML